MHGKNTRRPDRTIGTLTAPVLATGILLFNAAAALAAGSGEQVGENVGHLLGGWAKSLYVGVAAIVSLLFLLNRRFADLAVFMCAAVLVGGFVLAPAGVASVITKIWLTVTS